MFSKVLTKLVEYEKLMLVKIELYFSKETKKILQRIYKNKRSMLYNKINKAIKTHVSSFLNKILKI